MPATDLDVTACWGAVTRRDAAVDGAFVYAVATTGIYCRPSCPSRRPRREHVRFFATAAAAAKAGFRACKRCTPDGETPAAAGEARIAAAARAIEAATAPADLASLAAAAGMSQRHFHRTFLRLTGLTPAQYGRASRQRRLRDLLPASATVITAMYDAGYASSGRFYAEAPAALGMAPGRFRAGGRGVTIRFAVGQCSLGAVLVAATEQGICAIMLGDDPEAMLRELQDRFAEARLIGGDRDFEELMARVVGLVERPGDAAGLPLDVQGTAFQHRVWQALTGIPAGTTISYAELARRIGRPAAVRAVARACGANPVAVAIPCHRVVRSDGDLSGYRWGIERKRKLLAREQQD